MVLGIYGLYLNLGALRTLVDKVKKYRLRIVALQELRWSDTGSMQLKNITLFYGTCDNRRLGGSSFTVNKAYLNSVKDFKIISPRITVLTIAAKWFNIKFVNVHAPTEEKEEVEKDEFYSLPNNVLNDTPANCIQIILGNFNRKIGKENYFRPIISIQRLHEVSNGNKMFKHKNIHKGTWRSPNGLYVNQIDHMLVNSRFTNTMLNIKRARGADRDTEHMLLVGKLKVTHKRHVVQRK